MKDGKAMMLVIKLSVLVFIAAVIAAMVIPGIRSRKSLKNRNLVRADLIHLYDEFEKLDRTTVEVITIESLVPDPSVLNEDLSHYTFRNFGASDGTQKSIRPDGMRYQGIVYQGDLAGAEQLSITIEGDFSTWTPSPPRPTPTPFPAPGGAAESSTGRKHQDLVKRDLSYLHEQFEKLDPTTVEVITIESLSPDPSVLNEDLSHYTFRNFGASDGTQESIRPDGMRYQGIVYQGDLAGAEQLSITIEGDFSTWTPSPPRPTPTPSPAPGGSAESPTSGKNGRENKAPGK